MAKEKGQFDTFDSGSGPLIPSKAKEDFDHCDDGKGSYTMNDDAVGHGEVPSMPQKG